MEYLNLYDKSGNLLKERGVRGQENDGLVGIVIVFIENSKHQFLIQKTSAEKGSEWATTGGHVTYGTTFEESIIREMQEELGVDVKKENIEEAKTYIREKYVQKVFHVNLDIDVKDIKVQEEEVEYVKWLSSDEIENLISNNEFRKSNIEGFRWIIQNT